MSNKNKFPEITGDIKQLSSIASVTRQDHTRPKTTTREMPDNSAISSISSDIIKTISNNSDIEELFPDIERSMKVLVSSILSPNDMVSTKLIYKLDDLNLPGEEVTKIKETIATAIESEYKIEDKLTEMLEESIFTHGAYVECIIPDNTVKSMVKNSISLEDMKKAYISEGVNNEYKIFSNEVSFTSTVSLENRSFDYMDPNKVTDAKNIQLDFAKDLKVGITDNLNFLKYSKISLESKKTKVDDELSKLLETPKENLDETLDKLFNRKLKRKKSGLISINETMTKNKTRPLVMKLPANAVIPVHATGDISNHLGYFVLINKDGVPLDGTSATKYELDLDSNTRLSNIPQYALTSQVNKSLEGYGNNRPTLGNMEALYGDIIDSKIKETLKNSIYGESADVTDINEVYRVMFNRTLKGLDTNLLYLPANLVSYLAFRYRKNGTGESLLETVSLLSSIRAVLLFSNVISKIKGSITDTKISAVLDEEDPDPEKTKEILINEYMRVNNKSVLPSNLNRKDKIIDYFNKAGMHFDIKHKDLPNIEIDIEKSNRPQGEVNTELDDMLKNQTILKFALTPELIDNAKDVEFATTIVSNDMLLTKIIRQYQGTFSKVITKHVKTLIKYDGKITTVIEEFIRNNKKEIEKALIGEQDTKEEVDDIKALFEDPTKEDIIVYKIKSMIIDCLTVTLPTPETDEANALKIAFENYSDSLDTVLDYVMTTEAITARFDGDMVEGLVDEFKGMVKGVLLRKWMIENDYLTETIKYFKMDASGNESSILMNDHYAFIDDMAKTFIDYKKETKRKTKKTSTKIEKADADVVEEPTPTSTEVSGENGNGLDE